ncbi:MAG: DMT family transporter [Syntrophobacteraceae bacterium]
MNLRALRADILLLLTAAIWGGGFVAQRMGMEHVGPLTFNGVRFAMGGLSLLPLMAALRMRDRRRGAASPATDVKSMLTGGALAGLALFLGATLQQVGLLYTTAGKAGFITGLYLVIVPILGLFFRQRTDAGTWLGAATALVGLYLLSVTEQFSISKGDFLELVGAFFWAGHLIIIGRFTRMMDPLLLSFLQFMACSVLSLCVAAVTETISLGALTSAAMPILYGGLISVGVAYTLQVVAQKDASTAHAAIILSLEAVFATLDGWLILDESLSLKGAIGCALMLTGMMVSQLSTYLFPPKNADAR